jgi:hypothetical protein
MQQNTPALASITVRHRLLKFLEIVSNVGQGAAVPMICAAVGSYPEDALRFVRPQWVFKKLSGQNLPHPHPPICTMGPSGRHVLSP